MKKYNLSEIMKKAWHIKKSWNARGLSFGECLKRAWAEAKNKLHEAKYYGMKFVDGMKLEVDGYVRTLSRWTKSCFDRIYINGGSRHGDGYVDLKSQTSCLRGNLIYQKKISEMILSMEF